MSKNDLTVEQIERINTVIPKFRGVHNAETLTSDIESWTVYHDFPGWKATKNAVTDVVGHPRWIDHTEVRGTEFIANPYQLGLSAFEDFRKLEKAGFRVSISGMSNYSPSAIQVSIETAP